MRIFAREDGDCIGRLKNYSFLVLISEYALALFAFLNCPHFVGILELCPELFISGWPHVIWGEGGNSTALQLLITL